LTAGYFHIFSRLQIRKCGLAVNKLDMHQIRQLLRELFFIVLSFIFRIYPRTDCVLIDVLIVWRMR